MIHFLEKTSTEDECVNLMQEYISQNLKKYTPIYLIVGLVVNFVCNYYFTNQWALLEQHIQSF